MGSFLHVEQGWREVERRSVGSDRRRTNRQNSMFGGIEDKEESSN